MASTNAPVQNASDTVVLGFGNGTITCMIRETQSDDNTGTIEYVADEDGNDSAAVVSNKGKRLTCDGYLAHGQTAPAKGDIVSLDSVAYIVENSVQRKTPTVNRISLTLYRSNAATWSAASSN